MGISNFSGESLIASALATNRVRNNTRLSFRKDEKPKIKVCVVPGVGFHEEEPISFLKALKNGLPYCDISFYNWENNYVPPIISYKQSSFTMASRKLLTEIIFDAEWVLLHSLTMPLPKADVYIGHSAGSIVSLLHGNAPLIITMGSPASLIEGLESTNELSIKMDIFDAGSSRKYLTL
jgi:hypothetical protein